MQNETLNIIFSELKECDFKDLSYSNCMDKIVGNLPKDSFFLKELSARGISKIALFPRESNYVIKIPFIKYGSGTFYNANNSDDFSWDYCFSETVLYQKAKKEKVQKAFAKEKLLGKVNNHPIYIQEKVNTEEWLNQNDRSIFLLEQEIDKVRDECDFEGFDFTWEVNAYKYFGRKYYARILKFIKNNEINDLHNGNLGFIKKRPVIFDYSGFMDSYENYEDEYYHVSPL